MALGKERRRVGPCKLEVYVFESRKTLTGLSLFRNTKHPHCKASLHQPHVGQYRFYFLQAAFGATPEAAGIQVLQAERNPRLFTKQGSGKNAQFRFIKRSYHISTCPARFSSLAARVKNQTVGQHAYQVRILYKSYILETSSFGV